MCTTAAYGETTYVTGYTCPPYCAATSDDTPINEGVAACPSWWTGRQLQIDFPDGSRIVTCHDTYASWLSPRVDVFWWSLADCYSHTGYFNVTPLEAVIGFREPPLAP